ncbi:PP2C family protein-serine/threonine phosphatase [Spirillospora sp. CA-294931]|uniref:PP2C family protein-serine/threonine phosphatase n=1 Tax=Spirillospora sp. CA-294931 TaxID=3240042 RepID=UPI003D904F97
MTQRAVPAEIERVLRATPAHTLPEALEEEIRARLPEVTGVRLLLADYNLKTLVSPGEGEGDEPIRVRGTHAGRAFASRRPVSRRVVVDADGPASEIFVPVTARGERLGVLQAVTTAREPERLEGVLAEIAEVTGYALKVAWNHTDRYERARRGRRLTLAAELQWQLLPGQGCAGEEFSLAGHLEPAYSVGGDNFDWSTERDHVVLSVTNGSGTGIQAALLTALTVSALRNARRTGADLSEQAALAGDMVHARYGGEQFTETLVMRIDRAGGLVTAVDAGSPRILRMRGAKVTPIELDHQLPLGMFADASYEVQEFRVEPGDRLVIVSDGVYSAADPSGGDFGGLLLEQAVRRTRMQDAAEVPLSIIDALMDFHQARDLADDAVVLCLDWL